MYTRMNVKGTPNGVTMLSSNKAIYVPLLVLLSLFSPGDSGCVVKGGGRTHVECTDVFPDINSVPSSNLRHLDILHANVLPTVHLTPSYFAGNPNLKLLQSIRIQNTTLSSVDKNAFSGLKYLSDLDISDNSLLKSFHRESISEVPDLRTFSLSGNVHLFNRISGPILTSDSLEELDISRCEIEHLHKDAFSLLKRLSYLVLASNKITKIPAGTFYGHQNLRELDLSGNSVSNLPSFMFRNSSSVEVLKLRGNPISDVPTDVFEDSGYSVFELDLSETELTSINIPPLQSLAKLNLGGSLVSSLENFSQFPDLMHLNLSYTKITEIQSVSFEHNSHLETIILSGNTNLQLPRRFHGDFSYTELMDMSNCGLVSLMPNLFDEMTSIVILNLNRNALNDSESLGMTLSPLWYLEVLDLSNNKLRFIGQQFFSGNEQLKTLLLSGNPLASPPSLVKTPCLRHLDLSHCSLTRLHLPAIFRQASDLRYLSLSDNDLLSLTDEAYLEPMEDEYSPWSLPRDLEVLELDGNHWSCDRPFMTLIYEMIKMGVVPSKEPPQRTMPSGGAARDVQREWERLEKGVCENREAKERPHYDLAITLEPMNLPPALEGTVTAKFPVWLTVGILLALVLGSSVLLCVMLRRHLVRVRQSQGLILPPKPEGVKINVSLGSAGGGLKMGVRTKDYQRLKEDMSPSSPEMPRIYRPPPNGGHCVYTDIPDGKDPGGCDEQRDVV